MADPKRNCRTSVKQSRPHSLSADGVFVLNGGIAISITLRSSIIIRREPWPENGCHRHSCRYGLTAGSDRIGIDERYGGVAPVRTKSSAERAAGLALDHR